MSTTTVTIGDTTFDHVTYDRDADVLYLSVSQSEPAFRSYATPEGHAVRCNSDGAIVGVTLVNPRVLMERGDVRVTVPQALAVSRDELARALTS